jgi:hypothetical protein
MTAVMAGRAGRGQAFTTRRGSMTTPAAHAVHRLLHEHNVKEEQVLYPTTDRLLSEAERDELVGRIQAFSA